MASETVDPIDWTLPPPPTLHVAVPSELHLLHGVNAGDKSQDLLQQPGREHVSLAIPAKCTPRMSTVWIAEVAYLLCTLHVNYICRVTLNISVIETYMCLLSTYTQLNMFFSPILYVSLRYQLTYKLNVTHIFVEFTASR